MGVNIALIFQSILMGIGLAMDAFSVSVANGLSEPGMSKRKSVFISATFGFFQAAMPLLGWFLIKTVMNYFAFFQKVIPWLALGLLGYIGGKMIYETVKCKEESCKYRRLSISVLLVQGIATSIDALSVGLTISDYGFYAALITSFIIAIVTFGICMGGIYIGKKSSARFTDKAGIVGGCILILIGIEIFISGII